MKNKDGAATSERDIQLPRAVAEIAPSPDTTYTGKKSAANTVEKLEIVKGKAAIAYYAADQIIRDPGNLFFDAGSTLTMIARATFKRANKEGLSLVVTTNNMDISRDFLARESYSPDPNLCDVSLQLTGGTHNRQHHALFGMLAATTLNTVYPEDVFMGVTGLRFKDGLFYHGATEEQPIKTALYSKEVRRRILVCDHSKMGRRDLWLCTNKDNEGKEGLCHGVGEKTIIVTSQPSEGPGDSQFDECLEDLNKDKDLQKLLESGKLEFVVVRFKEAAPHWEVVRQWPSHA